MLSGVCWSPRLGTWAIWFLVTSPKSSWNWPSKYLVNFSAVAASFILFPMIKFVYHLIWNLLLYNFSFDFAFDFSLLVPTMVELLSFNADSHVLTTLPNLNGSFSLWATLYFFPVLSVTQTKTIERYLILFKQMLMIKQQRPPPVSSMTQPVQL